MAENDSGQERSEEATTKRRMDAREKGDIARSKELNTTAVLIAGSAGMIIFGGQVAAGLAAMMRYNFDFSRSDIFNFEQMSVHLSASFIDALLVVVPVLLLTLVAAVVGPIALGGWVMSAKALAPKLERIDPLKGLKRMFSAKALVELIKAIAKILVVVTLSFLILGLLMPDILAIGKQQVLPGMTQALSTVGWAVLGLSASMILISLFDIPFQLWDHAKKLKMTRQEVKDELKNTEGKPEVKSRIRQLQRDISQRRMMAAVPEADVVITNPEHYAVALRYNSDSMNAPVLVAKGADFIALKIREIAEANEVPVLSAPPLARAVFFNTEIDDEIPAGLYIAVAQVLAYVFQLKRYRMGKTSRPGPMPEVPIPDELQREPG